MSGKSRGIFCIEGEWEDDLRHRSSVLNLIEFLTKSNANMTDAIHRRVATVAAFEHYISRWKECPEHIIGYFAFHGEKGGIKLGNELLHLDELGEHLEGACHNKHIILSSCNTLFLPEGGLEEFRKRTKARSVSGYTRRAEWVESSALDLVLISSLLWYSYPSKADKWIRRHCEGLVKSYGFVMNYQTRTTAIGA